MADVRDAMRQHRESELAEATLRMAGGLDDEALAHVDTALSSMLDVVRRELRYRRKWDRRIANGTAGRRSPAY
jgi:hypothetical protein